MRHRFVVSLLVVVLMVSTSPADAAGVDSLRKSANEALVQGKPAQAVADLRRARMSILASERETELRAELTHAETLWITELAGQLGRSEADARIPLLLALRDEAKRIANVEGIARVEVALDEACLALWNARRGADDAQNLKLATMLVTSIGRASPMDAVLASTVATLARRVAGFRLQGVDGDYVRDRQMVQSENCTTVYSYTETEEQQETIEYRTHVEKETRTVRESTPSVQGTSTLRYTMGARFTVEGVAYRLDVADETSHQDEQYSHPKGGTRLRRCAPRTICPEAHIALSTAKHEIVVP